MADDNDVMAPSPTPDASMPPYNAMGAAGILGTPAAGPLPPDQQDMLQPQMTTDNGQSPNFQTTPASQDPEIQAAAAHHGFLAQHLLDAIHAIGDTLGGGVVYKVSKDADGNPILSKEQPTQGEKWGRIATGILGGAAKGFAAGQGPGGAARAISAGFDQGTQVRQQQQQQAEHEVDQSQKQMLFAANMAHLNQQITLDAWNQKHLDRDDLQKQQDYALKHTKEMSDMGIQPIMTGVKDGKTLAQYGIANPTAVGAHMGANGAMIYNEPDGKGGVNIYQLTADQGNMHMPDSEEVPLWSTDPDDATKVVKDQTITLPAGQTLKERSAQRMAINTANSNLSSKAQQARTSKEQADTKQQELEQKAPLVKAQTYEAAANAAYKAQQTNVLKGAGGAGGAAAQGLKGEQWLQASGIDPGAWNQIRSTANGDLKMPTASRSPQNQAFRQAVMNYDPTFTDARYETKQNFKTKGDATQLSQLSTALAHSERALKNSAVLGDSPSLLTGINLSGPAAAYNEDAEYFTGEQGKLVMGGLVGEKEADKIRSQISSPIQSIRDAGLREALRLTGGKVNAMYQKYRVGAGQDIPVQEFFDKPTQERLNRYGVGQPPNQPNQPTPPQNTNANTTQAARSPGPTRQQLQQAGVPDNAKSYHLMPSGQIDGWYDQNNGYHKLAGAK